MNALSTMLMDLPRLLRVTLCAALILGCSWSASSRAWAGESMHDRLSELFVLDWQPNGDPAPRSQDQVWMVSTRRLPYDCPSPTLDVQLFDPHGGWHVSSFDELVASGDPGTLTVVYVHGNRVSGPASIERGWFIYNSLTCEGSDPPPLRFIIWSWPSDRVAGPLRDVRSKFARTDAESYYLGWALASIFEQGPTSLIGYSYGARIVSGALHVLAGGTLAGRRIPHPVTAAEARQARVVLIVAALRDDSLLPTGQHGRALDRVDRLLLFYNPLDPVLKRYHVVDRLRRGRSVALGYAGAYRYATHGGPRSAIDQLNVQGIIGRAHNFNLYHHSPQLMGRIRQYVLWHRVV